MTTIDVVIRMLVAIVAAYVLILGPSPSTSEPSNHRCGKYSDGTWAYCDTGRCCSTSYYCGDTAEYCNRPDCSYQCHFVIVNPPTADSQTRNFEGVGVAHLANATRNNHYLNGTDENDDDGLGKVAPAYASPSSSSSSSASPLSCATSLARLSLVSRHKYPFAALGAPRTQNNVTATRCGRCLEVTTNVGVGGIPNQVKVRVAHEHNKQGLELDFKSFSQLDTNGSGIANSSILVKYKFVSC
ncbi:unnamed protein product [Linum tenue]|uniref:Chitin-binding type-1 domain-containing protein n=1 Tax=Linum tenue TaxID=586396 RepID=A0AAV0NPZ2_9ROSI|nr:unnamed protein product [Linum tenue]